MVCDIEVYFGCLDVLINNVGVMYLELVVEVDLGCWW